MRKKNRKKAISEINVTPFVDVMLVLLIIFMVTAPLLTSGIKINLPESSSILKNEKKEPVTISLNKKGKIFINKKVFTTQKLITKLKALEKVNKNLKIYVKADKSINYGKVMDLMTVINNAGFKKVALVTKLKWFLMVTGLFKSSFLHLAIVLIFLYGAEIFKRNKRFEIVEIPLDIVEVSEKTVTKKNIPKAQQKPKKNQSYTPPEVLLR